jgi:hypothetical protein
MNSIRAPARSTAGAISMDGWSCIQEEVFNAGATEANAPSTVEKIYVNGIRIDEPILAAIDGDLDGTLNPDSLNRLPWVNWEDAPPGEEEEPVDFVYYYCENGTVGNIMALICECTEGEEPPAPEEMGGARTPSSAALLDHAVRLDHPGRVDADASTEARAEPAEVVQHETVTTNLEGQAEQRRQPDVNGTAGRPARPRQPADICVKPLEYYRFQAYGTPDVYPIVDTDLNGWEDTPWTLADNNTLMVTNRAARPDYGRWSLHCGNQFLFHARRLLSTSCGVCHRGRIAFPMVGTWGSRDAHRKFRNEPAYLLNSPLRIVDFGGAEEQDSAKKQPQSQPAEAPETRCPIMCNGTTIGHIVVARYGFVVGASGANIVIRFVPVEGVDMACCGCPEGSKYGFAQVVDTTLGPSSKSGSLGPEGKDATAEDYAYGDEGSRSSVWIDNSHWDISIKYPHSKLVDSVRKGWPWMEDTATAGLLPTRDEAGAHKVKFQACLYCEKETEITSVDEDGNSNTQYKHGHRVFGQCVNWGYSSEYRMPDAPANANAKAELVGRELAPVSCGDVDKDWWNHAWGVHRKHPLVHSDSTLSFP